MELNIVLFGTVAFALALFAFGVVRPRHRAWMAVCRTAACAAGIGGGGCVVGGRGASVVRVWVQGRR